MDVIQIISCHTLGLRDMTCFAVRTCDGLYHFIFSIDPVGILFGFQPIVWTFVKQTVSRCLIFPALKVTWSGLDQSIANKIGSFQFLPRPRSVDL